MKHKTFGKEITCFIHDPRTNTYYPWDDITEITEDMIGLNEEEYQEAIKFLNNSTSSFSFTIADDLSEGDESKPKAKPNPVYVPKHIAHRKKGRK